MTRTILTAAILVAATLSAQALEPFAGSCTSEGGPKIEFDVNLGGVGVIRLDGGPWRRATFRTPTPDTITITARGFLGRLNTKTNEMRTASRLSTCKSAFK